MKLYSVYDPEFRHYGQIVEGMEDSIQEILAVVPIMFFGAENGKVTGELTVDSPQVTVSAFYVFIKYSILDLEYLRDVEYGAYN